MDNEGREADLPFLIRSNVRDSRREGAERVEARRPYPTATLEPWLPAARSLAGMLFLRDEFGEFLAFRTNPWRWYGNLHHSPMRSIFGIQAV